MSNLLTWTNHLDTSIKEQGVFSLFQGLERTATQTLMWHSSTAKEQEGDISGGTVGFQKHY